MIQSAEVYQLLMERDGTYAEQSEAAVAAMLLGVELTIYASAAPPGVDPSPQNLYPEASGLGELCSAMFEISASRQHRFTQVCRAPTAWVCVAVCRSGRWSATKNIVNES